MKRYSIIAILLCAFALNVLAAKQPIAFKEVPEPVQKAVLENFKKEQVQFITCEKEVRNHEYEIVLKDGTTLKYDDKAKLREVKNSKGVKEVYIPKNIQKYVSHIFPNTVISKYKVESYRQKVELDEKMILVFNKRGKFLRIDN